jgi:hypothetical protein
MIFRSTSPVKRAMDVVCLIILQLLTLMVLATEQDQEKLRNHPALGPNSILARLGAGETFDLPLAVIASIRTITSQIRSDLRLGGFEVKQSGAPSPATAQNQPAQAKATRQRSIARHPPAATWRDAPHTLQTLPMTRQAVIRGFFKEQAFRSKVYPRPIRCGIETNWTPPVV